MALRLMSLVEHWRANTNKCGTNHSALSRRSRFSPNLEASLSGWVPKAQLLSYFHATYLILGYTGEIQGFTNFTKLLLLICGWLSVVFHNFMQYTDPSCSTLHHTCYLNVITSAFDKAKTGTQLHSRCRMEICNICCSLKHCCFCFYSEAPRDWVVFLSFDSIWE